MIGSSDSDSDDDKRIVRSAKDRRFDELKATCEEMRVSFKNCSKEQLRLDACRTCNSKRCILYLSMPVALGHLHADNHYCCMIYLHGLCCG
jgi:hypothetical protein